MKKYLITFLLVLSASFSFAQAQNSNHEGHRFHCEIKCIEKGLKASKKIVFDFGDTTSYRFWDCKSKRLKFVDEKGKTIKFGSMVEVANFLVERGWTFDKAYSATCSQKESVIHWIFYKDVENSQEIKEGLVTGKQFKANMKQKKQKTVTQKQPSKK